MRLDNNNNQRCPSPLINSLRRWGRRNLPTCNRRHCPPRPRQRPSPLSLTQSTPLIPRPLVFQQHHNDDNDDQRRTSPLLFDCCVAASVVIASLRHTSSSMRSKHETRCPSSARSTDTPPLHRRWWGCSDPRDRPFPRNSWCPRQCRTIADDDRGQWWWWRRSTSRWVRMYVPQE